MKLMCERYSRNSCTRTQGGGGAARAQKELANGTAPFVLVLAGLCGVLAHVWWLGRQLMVGLNKEALCPPSL